MYLLLKTTVCFFSQTILVFLLLFLGKSIIEALDFHRCGKDMCHEAGMKAGCKHSALITIRHRNRDKKMYGAQKHLMAKVLGHSPNKAHSNWQKYWNINTQKWDLHLHH